MRSASDNVTLPGVHGHDLAARLHRSGTTPRAYALFAHGFTCTKESGATLTDGSRRRQQHPQHRPTPSGAGPAGGDTKRTMASRI